MAIGFKLPVVCHKLYRVTAGKMNNFTRPNASSGNKTELKLKAVSVTVQSTTRLIFNEKERPNYYQTLY